MGPMVMNRRPAKTDDKAFQEPGVFAFLSDKKLQRVEVDRIVTDLPAGAVEQKGSSTGLSQLKMRERSSQNLLPVGIQRTGQVPFRFGPVSAVVSIIIEPIV